MFRFYYIVFISVKYLFSGIVKSAIAYSVGSSVFFARLLMGLWCIGVFRRSLRVFSDGYQVYAVNGMEEHIHVVMRLPATVKVADVVGKLKGSSSRFLSEHFGLAFKWQEGYGAMTFGKRDLEKVVGYCVCHRFDAFISS